MAVRLQKLAPQGQQQNNNPGALALKICAHSTLATNGENALIMQRTLIVKKFCENSKQNAKTILAMVLLSNNKMINPLITMETPAMEMQIPLAIC
jgi:hypothetical protein